MVSPVDQQLVRATEAIICDKFDKSKYFHGRVLQEVRKNLDYRFKIPLPLPPFGGFKVTKNIEGKVSFFIDFNISIQEPKNKWYSKTKTLKLELRICIEDDPQNGYIAFLRVDTKGFETYIEVNINRRKPNFENLIMATIEGGSNKLIPKIKQFFS